MLNSYLIEPTTAGSIKLINNIKIMQLSKCKKGSLGYEIDKEIKAEKTKCSKCGGAMEYYLNKNYCKQCKHSYYID